MGFKQTQRAAFETFDPRYGGNADKFDPRVANGYNGADEAGAAVETAYPGQKMQVNVTLTNNAAGTLTLELFNYMTSCVYTRNTSYVSGSYLYIPQDSYEGIQAIIADTDGTIGWDQSGNLVVRGTPANPSATVACAETSYRSLFTASGITPFFVSYLRLTVSNDNQINENIFWFQRTMAGAEVRNTISPRSYFRPNQFQDLTIDITTQFTVGVDSGLRVNVLAGQYVRMALFIQAWTNQSIGQ